MITALLGIVLLTLGLVAAVRAGFDGTFEEPEQAHAWWLVTAAVIVVLAALLVPRSTRTSEHVYAR